MQEKKSELLNHHFHIITFFGYHILTFYFYIFYIFMGHSIYGLLLYASLKLGNLFIVYDDK